MINDVPLVNDEERSVRLRGDAYLTFTAPFYTRRDPLEPRRDCVIPAGDGLDGAGALVRSAVSLRPLLQIP